MLTKWENEGEGGGQHRPEASPGRGAKCTVTQAPNLSVHALTTSVAALGGGEWSPEDQAPVSVPLHPGTATWACPPAIAFLPAQSSVQPLALPQTDHVLIILPRMD